MELLYFGKIKKDFKGRQISKGQSLQKELSISAEAIWSNETLESETLKNVLSLQLQGTLIESLKLFQAFKSLNKLELHDISLSNFEGIEYFEKLQFLTFLNLEGLKSTKSLKKLKLLSDLTLELKLTRRNEYLKAQMTEVLKNLPPNLKSLHIKNYLSNDDFNIIEQNHKKLNTLYIPYNHSNVYNCPTTTISHGINQYCKKYWYCNLYFSSMYKAEPLPKKLKEMEKELGLDYSWCNDTGPTHKGPWPSQEPPPPPFF